MPLKKELVENKDGSYTLKWTVPYKKPETKVNDLQNLYSGPPCHVCGSGTRENEKIYTYPVSIRTRICQKHHIVHEEIEVTGAPTYISRF